MCTTNNDDECLELASSVRNVLFEFAERLGQALKRRSKISLPQLIDWLIKRKSPNRKRQGDKSNEIYNKTYISLSIVLIVSFVAALVLPMDNIFRGITLLQRSVLLFIALYQIFRDQAAYEKNLNYKDNSSSLIWALHLIWQMLHLISM